MSSVPPLPGGGDGADGADAVDDLGAGCCSITLPRHRLTHMLYSCYFATKPVDGFELLVGDHVRPPNRCTSRFQNRTVQRTLRSRAGVAAYCRDVAARRRRNAGRSAAWLRNGCREDEAAAAAEADAAAAAKAAAAEQSQERLPLSPEDKRDLVDQFGKCLHGSVKVLRSEYDWDLEDAGEMSHITSLSYHLHCKHPFLEPDLLPRLAGGGMRPRRRHTSTPTSATSTTAANSGSKLAAVDADAVANSSSSDDDESSELEWEPIDEEQVALLNSVLADSLDEAHPEPGGDGGGDEAAVVQVLRDVYQLVGGLLLRYRLARSQALARPNGLPARLARVAKVRRIRAAQQRLQQQQQGPEGNGVSCGGGGGGGGGGARPATAPPRVVTPRVQTLPFAHGLFLATPYAQEDEEREEGEMERELRPSLSGSDGGGGGGAGSPPNGPWPHEAPVGPQGSGGDGVMCGSGGENARDCSCSGGAGSSGAGSSGSGGGAVSSTPAAVGGASGRGGGGAGRSFSNPLLLAAAAAAPPPRLVLEPGQAASLRKEHIWLGVHDPLRWEEVAGDVVRDALSYSPPVVHTQHEHRQPSHSRQTDGCNGGGSSSGSGGGKRQRRGLAALRDYRIALRMCGRAYLVGVTSVQLMRLTDVMAESMASGGVVTFLGSPAAAALVRERAAAALAAAVGSAALMVLPCDLGSAVDDGVLDLNAEVAPEVLRLGELCMGLQALQNEVASVLRVQPELVGVAAETWHAACMHESRLATIGAQLAAAAAVASGGGAYQQQPQHQHQTLGVLPMLPMVVPHADLPPGLQLAAVEADGLWQAAIGQFVFWRGPLIAEPLERMLDEQEARSIFRIQVERRQRLGAGGNGGGGGWCSALATEALAALRAHHTRMAAQAQQAQAGRGGGAVAGTEGLALQGVSMAGLRLAMGDGPPRSLQAWPLTQSGEEADRQWVHQVFEWEDASMPGMMAAVREKKAAAALYVWLVRQRRVRRPRGSPSLEPGIPATSLVDCTDPWVTACVMHLVAWRTAVEPDLSQAMDVFLVGVLPVQRADGKWDPEGDAFRGAHGRSPHLLLSLRHRVASTHRVGTGTGGGGGCKAAAFLSLRSGDCFDQVYDAVMATLSRKAPRPPVVLELYGCQAIHMTLAALAKAHQDGLAKAAATAAAAAAAAAAKPPPARRSAKASETAAAAAAAAAKPPPLQLFLQVGIHDRIVRAVAAAAAAATASKLPATAALEAALRAAVRTPRAHLAWDSPGRPALKAVIARWQAAGEWEEVPLRVAATWVGGEGAAPSKIRVGP